MAQRRKKIVKLSKKQARYQSKVDHQPVTVIDRANLSRPLIKKEVLVPKSVSIRRLSDLTQIPVSKIILTLMKYGLAVNINQSIDFETVAIIADELGVKAALDSKYRSITSPDTVGHHQKPRPPVVTVMGHVDHGKTSLLDAILHTSVAQTEAGQITQKISAYQADSITFIDTPGHEAFSALRVHGALITDIVVLVVAANEGVKPQTIEAISHAQASKVPIIVAINKVDLAGGNVDRVKQQISESGLKPDSWGGETPYVEVSAAKRLNIQELLETIKLVASLQNLTAQYDGPARGIVIEVKKAVGIGRVASVLVKQGTLRTGDYIVFERSWGKIRTMADWQGRSVMTATPSTPVTVTGLKGLPTFGESFQVVEDRSDIVQILNQVGNDSLLDRTSLDRADNPLPIIIKADSSGSLESIKHTLADLLVDHKKYLIIQSGVGSINESDIKLAQISNAWLVGFQVKLPTYLQPLVQAYQVVANIYDLIYDLISDAEKKLSEVDFHKKTESVNEAKILKVFRQDPKELLVGALTSLGVLRVGQTVQIERGGQVIWLGAVGSIRQGKLPLNQASANMEVGMTLKKQLSDDTVVNVTENDIIRTLPKK